MVKYCVDGMKGDEGHVVLNIDFRSWTSKAEGDLRCQIRVVVVCSGQPTLSLLCNAEKKLAGR